VIDGRRVIAIIPARGGSKGLPSKNLRPLCGVPLIGWSIRKALQSHHLDCVMVSTDSPEIANVAAGLGAEVPFQRPAELAGDASSTYDVIRHALDHYRQADRTFDYTLLLEPTSPLREDGDIDAVIEQLDAHRDAFDSIVTLGRVNEHPSIMKRLVGLRIEPFAPELPAAARRQDQAPAYFPYGVAYAAKTAVLLDENTFYTRRCMGHAIRRHQNYEIDDLHDFLCVEAVMRHEWGLA
jgi:CMP-N,N'-diacetyllegionaminic acid synthase